MPALRLLCATLLALALLAPAASADVEGPIPATAHPGDPSRDYPFFASDDGLAADGYVEREYFVSGTATRYSANGTTTATPTGTHPFKTRIVVRRPASPKRFNGTVVVEWFNVSNQYDQEVDWLQTHEHLVREGYAWVGVSAQRAGIHSATGLRAWNPRRYGSLDVTAGGTINDDTLSFDVFTQAGRALDDGPLGPLKAKRLLATGHSQSATRLRTYYNSIHPLAQLYDGFVMHGIFGNTQLRTDIETPAWKLQSETDALGFGPAGTTRQPDSEFIRTWEVAGTTHGDWKLIVEHGPLRIRDVGAPPDDYPPGPSLCNGPTFSRIPFYMTQGAAYDQLARWASTGKEPPSAPQVEGPPAVRDEHGNILGGIRLPTFAVPTATDSGANAGPGFCFLHGVHQPFSQETLDALYPSEHTYRAQVAKAAARSLSERHIAPSGALATVLDTVRFGLPVRGEGTVHSVSYRSPVLGTTRRMQVYTPPGYAQKRGRYPVLYLIHGGGDDDTGWLAKGDAKAIVDAALARDAAKRMIVVMPDARVGTNLGRPASEDPFPRELVRGVLPAVEKRFRVERGSKGRALAGLSLGGVQILDTLLRYPGAFDNVSAWSTGWFPVQIADLEDRRLDVEAINRGTDTLELRIGQSDFAYANMTATRNLLDDRGIYYEYGETPGGHEWPVWQRYLRELLPRLFRETEFIEP